MAIREPSSARRQAAGRGCCRRGSIGALLCSAGARLRDRSRWGGYVRRKAEALSHDVPWGERSTDLRPAAGARAAASSGGPAATEGRASRRLAVRGAPHPALAAANTGIGAEQPTPRPSAPVCDDRSPLGLGRAENGAQIRATRNQRKWIENIETRGRATRSSIR
ncbi:hypothetical protein NDU88_004458 [Pleurodeles waltl]|uniref:Uncharacterized protein n=1 Tax=Pleurodeles waltl TaxID=8319 RepID=A0AAV7UFE0_PLEWA|nr:hypothetical protein NDU88_004458 [Pleurodeles waltl]